ncbi:MAG: hypothetical protein ACOX6I_00425 [Syntrophomonadaceae bacterium]|jgi:hypothetical protein
MTARRKLTADDIKDANIYEDVWLDFGDDKYTDIMHLIEQGRIRRV